jgi:hypothetical protein
MEIQLLRAPANASTLDALGRARGGGIRLAVDVERGVVAAGGEFHADCEEALLDDGSVPENVWGADLDPDSGALTFRALINIKPQQGGRTMAVEEPTVRTRIAEIVRELCGVVS